MSQKKVSKEELGELSDREMELIHMLRTNFRWGPVKIEMKNGQPWRIMKAYITHAIGQDDPFS